MAKKQTTPTATPPTGANPRRKSPNANPNSQKALISPQGSRLPEHHSKLKSHGDKPNAPLKRQAATPREYDEKGVEPLTEDERLEIARIYSIKFPRLTGPTDFYLSAEPHFLEFGQLRNMEEATLVAWIDRYNQAILAEADRPGESPVTSSGLAHRILTLVAERIDRNDFQYFLNIARIIRERSQGKRIAEIPLRQMKVKQMPGRKLKPYDLKIVVPLAFRHVIACRLFFISPADIFDTLPKNIPEWANIVCRPYRITKEEILAKIQSLRRAAGLKFPPKIRDRDLSRWISEYGIKKFMALRCCD